MFGTFETTTYVSISIGIYSVTSGTRTPHIINQNPHTSRPQFKISSQQHYYLIPFVVWTFLCKMSTRGYIRVSAQLLASAGLLHFARGSISSREQEVRKKVLYHQASGYLRCFANNTRRDRKYLIRGQEAS